MPHTSLTDDRPPATTVLDAGAGPPPDTVVGPGRPPARKRRRVLLQAAAATVVVAVAGALYLMLVPGQLAARFEDRAQPRHAALQVALERVHRVFGRRGLQVSVGGIQGAHEARISEADSPARWVAAVERDEAAEQHRLRRVRAAIRTARAALAAGADQMTSVPSLPLLGSAGETQRARRVAALQRRYLGQASAFLDDYQALVGYALAALEHYRRDVLLDAEEEEEVDAIERHGDARLLAARLGRIATERARLIAAFAERSLPAALQPLQHAQLRLDRAQLHALRAITSALRDRDFRRVQRILNREREEVKRLTGQQTRAFTELLRGSGLRRAITQLRALERQIALGYAQI